MIEPSAPQWMGILAEESSGYSIMGFLLIIPFTTLLAKTTFQLFCYYRPAFLTVFTNQLLDAFIFLQTKCCSACLPCQCGLSRTFAYLFCPWAFHQARSENFAPPMKTLDVGASRDALGDFFPVLALQSSDRYSKGFILKGNIISEMFKNTIVFSLSLLLLGSSGAHSLPALVHGHEVQIVGWAVLHASLPRCRLPPSVSF